MKLVGDLHNHTYFSDGKLSPYQIISTYARLNYKLISITDHDTLKGYFEAMRFRNMTPNMKIIPGCELTISFLNGKRKFSIHLLLYFKKEDVFNREFLNEFEKITDLARGNGLLKRRLSKMKEIFGKELENISEDDFKKIKGVITRKQIFETLIKKGMEEKRAREILSNSSPAYIPSGIPLSEVIPFLKKYKMIKVMAHPAVGSSDNDNYEKDVYPPIEEVIPIIKEFHDLKIIDGIEIFYPAHKKEHMEQLKNLGKELNLKLFTGGSDCHDLKKRPPAKAGMDLQLVKNFLKVYDNL